MQTNFGVGDGDLLQLGEILAAETMVVSLEEHLAIRGRQALEQFWDPAEHLCPSDFADALTAKGKWQR